MMLSFVLLLKCILCSSVFLEGKPIHEEVLNEDFGANVTLPCHNSQNEIIKWEKQGRISKQILSNGDLFLNNVQKDDSGLYQCSMEMEDEILSKIQLNINTPPAALEDVTIMPSTVHALIRWRLGDNGGYPITNITINYKEVNTVKWHYSRPIHPTSKNVDIFELKPNSSYLFQIWASNKLGPGEIVNKTAKTLNDIQEIELAHHFLRGVETFDARIWLVAIAVMMTTLLILTLGMCLVTCCDWHFPKKEQQNDDPERIELIPNIIVNPSCNIEVSPCPQYATSQNTDEDDDDDLTTIYFACRNGAKAIDV